MFRGKWYFSNLPFNLIDTPLISNWCFKKSNNLILKIINKSKIKKAIFVYNLNKKFIYKFERITYAQKELNINYDIILKNMRY